MRPAGNARLPPVSEAKENRIAESLQKNRVKINFMQVKICLSRIKISFKSDFMNLIVKEEIPLAYVIHPSDISGTAE